ncbi:hypothetical protein FDJ25_gp117 [Vibrio phage Aphrodite1]|uniref:Uncharacterized protein n=1 Tax=Vibrio phage Aphrodite1 TaxID=2070057 RepID=A0A2I7QHZ3_9CAUD|nr:hypothetical protein FDJ25_gp117 [Vibrio phage Aphrodite1]AUR81016.1 hypothetical protein Aphrodite1_0086 [Vibrio phage Aphrodite1]
MDIVRYTYVRSRLIELWRELSFHGFRMFVPKHMFLTPEEITNHDHISYEGSYAWGSDLYAHNHYLVTVPMLKDLIKGINTESSIGFYDAEDSIWLFKHITEYLELWMEVANEAPQYYIPHIPELYDLEEVALWVFHTYKPIMIHRANMKLAKRRAEGEDTKIDPFLLLIQMGASESVDEIPDQISYSSILDDRLPERLKSHYNQIKRSQSTMDVEDEWRVNMSDIADLLDMGV